MALPRHVIAAALAERSLGPIDGPKFEVIAISAHTLNDGIKHDIEAQIRELYPEAERVIITPQHDTSAIGGVRLELANQQLDLSVRGKLNLFKQLTVQGKE
jgi:F0F1-type ATP synthase delta subunit